MSIKSDIPETAVSSRQSRFEKSSVGFDGRSSRTRMTEANMTQKKLLVEEKKRIYHDNNVELVGVRKISLNPIDNENLPKFPPNKIITSRYKWFTYLPKHLWEQSLRKANFWFLIFGLLQVFLPRSEIYALEKYLLIIPWIVHIFCRAGADLTDFIDSSTNDRIINSKKCLQVCPHGYFQELRWDELKVGDIIRVHENEDVPADMLILSTSNPEGVTYIETLEVDGKHELTMKKAVKKTRGNVTVSTVCNIRGRIRCSPPSDNLNEFSGALRLDAHPRVSQLVSANLLMKGSVIRRTSWVYGGIIYTGPDCRIAKNNPIKQAPKNALEILINDVLIVPIIFVFTMCLIGTLIFYFSLLPQKVNGYVEQNSSIFTMYITNLTACSDGIPLLLFIIIDITRLILTRNHAHLDLKMENEPTRQKKYTTEDIKVSSKEALEAAGNVDFLFLDTTGILTQSGAMIAKMAVEGQIQSQIIGIPQNLSVGQKRNIDLLKNKKDLRGLLSQKSVASRKKSSNINSRKQEQKKYDVRSLKGSDSGQMSIKTTPSCGTVRFAAKLDIADSMLSGTADICSGTSLTPQGADIRSPSVDQLTSREYSASQIQSRDSRESIKEQISWSGSDTSGRKDDSPTPPSPSRNRFMTRLAETRVLSQKSRSDLQFVGESVRSNIELPDKRASEGSRELASMRQDKITEFVELLNPDEEIPPRQPPEFQESIEPELDVSKYRRGESTIPRYQSDERKLVNKKSVKYKISDKDANNGIPTWLFELLEGIVISSVSFPYILIDEFTKDLKEVPREYAFVGKEAESFQGSVTTVPPTTMPSQISSSSSPTRQEASITVTPDSRSSTPKRTRHNTIGQYDTMAASSRNASMSTTISTAAISKKNHTPVWPAKNSLLSNPDVILNAHVSTQVPNQKFFYKKLRYEGLSSYDAYLTRLGATMGCTLLSCNFKSLSIDNFGIMKRFEIVVMALHRNIKTLTVRRTASATVFCKGELSEMTDLIDERYLQSEKGQQCLTDAKKLSSEGMTVFVICRRSISSTEADLYQHLYNEAKSGTHDNVERLNRMSLDVHQNMELLGVVGIRHLSVPRISRLIHSFTSSGIRIWMMTHRAVDAAIRGAVQSYLMSSSSTVFQPVADEINPPEYTASKLYKKFRQKYLEAKNEGGSIALVVSGETIETLLKDEPTIAAVLTASCNCDFVLIHSVSQLQKQFVAQTLRNRITPNPVIVGIGTGAKDLPLIHASDVGVIIPHLEGNSERTLREADITVNTIHDLKNFMYGNGRLSVYRFGTLLHNGFFFGAFLVTANLMFAAQNLYSSKLFFTLTHQFFLYVLATSIPLIVISIFDYDVPAEETKYATGLYYAYRQRFFFSRYIIFLSILEGFFYGLVNFLLVSALFSTPTIVKGQSLDYFCTILLNFFSVSLGLNLKFLLKGKPQRRVYFPILFVFLTAIFILFFLFTLGKDSPYPDFKRGAILLMVHPGTFCTLAAILFLDFGISTCIHLLKAKFNKLYTEQLYVQLVNDSSIKIHRKNRNLKRFKYQRPRMSLGRGWARSKKNIQAHNIKGTNNKDATSVEVFVPQIEHGTTDGEASTTFSEDGRTTDRSFFSKKGHDRLTSSPSQPSGILSSDSSQEVHNTNVEEEEQTGYEETSGPTDVDVEISYLISGLSLTFNDQQLEADYLAYRMQQTKVYKNSYRMMVFLLCFCFLFFDLLSFFAFDEIPESYYKITINFLPDVTFVLLFVASLYEFLFVDRFDSVMGMFFFLYTILKTTADYILQNDGSVAAAFFPVVSFVFLQLRFIHAMIYNVCYTSMFIARYCVTVWELNIIRAEAESDPDSPTFQFSIRSWVNWFMPGPLLEGIPQIHRPYAFIEPMENPSLFFLGDNLRNVTFQTLLHTLPVLMCISLFTGFVGFKVEFNQRKRYLMDYRVLISRRKQGEILNTMLPPFVVQYMLTSELGPDGLPVGLGAQEQGEISVIFTDVYNFQKIVSLVEPTHLVQVLDSLFLYFDKCAERFDCTKIETVSETFLAVSGLCLVERAKTNEPQQDAVNAIDMAFAMLDICNFIAYEIVEYYSGAPATGIAGRPETPVANPFSSQSASAGAQGVKIRKEQIRVKIGIHSGPAISGVVGAKKPQFALFGDTVNTASRMKTTGEPDKINISSSTHHLVKDDEMYEFEERDVEVKGKGTMTTYFVKPKSTQNSSPLLRGKRRMSLAESVAAAANEQLNPDASPPSSHRNSAKFQISDDDPSLYGNPGGKMDVDQDQIQPNLDDFSPFEIVTARSGVGSNCMSGSWWRQLFNNWDKNLLKRLTCSKGTVSAACIEKLISGNDTALEYAYRMHHITDEANISTIEQALVIFLVSFVIQTVIIVSVPRYDDSFGIVTRKGVCWTVRTIFTVTSFFVWLLLHYREKSSENRIVRVKWIIFFLNTVMVMACCVFLMEASWGYIVQESGKPVWLSVDTIVVLFFVTIIHHNSAEPTKDTQEAAAIIPIFLLLNLFACSFKETVARQTFFVNKEMRETEDRGRSLLADMLPKQVLEEYKQDKLKLAYSHQNMGFMFADICGFTSWAKNVPAAEVVSMLQKLFSQFDHDTTRFKLFKLCTIGDAYVAVTEPTINAPPLPEQVVGAQAVIGMARAMLVNIHNIRARLGIDNLNMRIGLHRGNSVGGVIGSGRLRYDLWGFDVLVGNMMESGGVPGKICCSKRFMNFLDEELAGRYDFEFNKDVDVIGQSVKSYVLKEPAEKTVFIPPPQWGPRKRKHRREG
eukprot:GHVP01055223.1.p1 GENE.GHVP01055223.1~~GHVP01055223.1.p1  ORF type:complete len:2749 (+),score=416.25 GHVP01055223.1:44-8290(+)